MPNPVTASPGSSPAEDEPAAAQASSRQPAATTSAPSDRICRPSQLTRAAEPSIAAKKPTPAAVNTMPDSSALSWRPCCRYSASTKKNDGGTSAKVSAASEPRPNVRLRSRPKSTSGARPADRRRT